MHKLLNSGSLEAALHWYTLPDYPAQLRGPWGNARRIQVYTIDIVISNMRLPGIEIVGAEMGNEVILGLSLLNRLVLLLDGPGQQSDVYDQRPRVR